MEEWLERSVRMFGESAIEKLAGKRVAIFGIGGVGGHACEALVRSGIGHFDLIDKDCVEPSNLNRQIVALRSSLGKPKVEVMRERMLDINPDADVLIYRKFFLPENADDFPFSEYDYVLDAVDTVTAKIALVMKTQEACVPVISAMGAGNKLDPSRFRVMDIYDTKVCPLARVMRKELKERGVKHLKVVCSDEPPHTQSGGRTPGSNAFVPAAAGLLMAAETVRELSCYSKRN